MRAHGYGNADFVRTLAEKSGGVWMYLYYVIREIAEGDRAPLDLAKLPSGLAGYYAEYWGRWRADVERWDALYAPLLATLAAAQDALTVERLLLWGAVNENPYTVRRLLDDHWQAFLKRSDDRCYALYHASLRDFLTGDVSRLGRTSDVTDEMRERTRDAHARIVAHYRAQCDGDWPKLADNDYARRYLCTHLAGAGQHVELFALVAQSNAWAEARYRIEESYAGYLTDLELAWRWAESSEWNVGRQIRCAIIKSSIHSLAGNIWADLLVQLTEVGLWSTPRALAYIRQMPNERRRTEALNEIATLLPEALRPEALAIIREITDEWERAEALSVLTNHLSGDLKAELAHEALLTARAISDQKMRALALCMVAEKLPDGLKAAAVHEVLATAPQVADKDLLDAALNRLADHLPKELSAPVLDMVAQISSEIKKKRMLVRDEVAKELAMAERIADDEQRIATLVQLAMQVPTELRADAVPAAFGAAQKIARKDLRAQMLAFLVGLYPEGFKTDVLREVLMATHEIADARAHARALSSLAPHLPYEAQAEALRMLRNIDNEHERAEALISLAGHLSGESNSEALSIAQGITNNRYRARALSGLVSFMSDEVKAEAEQEALVGWSLNSAMNALSGSAGHDSVNHAWKQRAGDELWVAGSPISSS